MPTETNRKAAKPLLILTRRVEEEIYIGDDIVIKVTEIKGNRVKLGISAPAGVEVLRDDVKNKTTRERSKKNANSV